ncbi:hypothetical protein HN51_071242 [Arachis hypogaea]|uniref:Protein PLASTID MOVEMENT IMPAIRED 2 n=1 Tax=Arachis hypogaea TaxID=3818 RepID=A0A444YYW3_ARAHY|nr:protein PLASTID MOVEMENT IMPAIRED 2-like [Arachis ipaensis]XP_020958707.1 protein PLASTID MOVEMENT IMPAIRED 2-like [Arachis ipaensis]XP_025656374.1 protein PLASTID MOVEMENT IMPAIRED 2 [Arachis hypogaea]QHO13819.1 Protein PLASTID MOVEMENT IMPAIRED [Arachis hypogaea]QHO13820.1 Protein PLASTID MOVEMENT IMPAIRED [Arachis hypogaea]RYR07120.1 hypothetical protein Ahy_B05g074440 [Arachis hypogaea]
MDCLSSSKYASTSRELQRARRDAGWYKERRRAADSAKAEAEYELSTAKKTVKDLSSMIEKSSYKVKAHKQERASLELKLHKAKRKDNSHNHEYSQVMRELEYAKHQLFQLKLDVDAVLKEKSQAEMEMEASLSSVMHGSRTVELLRKEIEEANEEQVLVELARIDALKEVEDIKARREKEAKEILFELEKLRKKLKEGIEEINKSKEHEMKLAMTLSDVGVLQNELKHAKEMDKRVRRHESTEHIEGASGKWEELSESPPLETLEEEVEVAKKDLALIREEGFQFMASMDVIRNEMKQVSAETVGLKEESKSGTKVQNLNSKILRAKSKLEGLIAAEEKDKSIVTSLQHSLNKLNAEIETAEKEKELVYQEVTKTKAEIERSEFEKDMAEERLKHIMKELEAIKLSESLALEKLEALTENAMRDRGLATQNRSSITISKFEYEYLTNRAAEAEKIADKKVAAAKAWTEAVKASEKEILIRAKIAETVIKETKVEDYNKERLVTKKVGREELENWPRKGKNNASSDLQMQRSLSQKSNKSNGSVTPARGSKFQKSASPATRVSPFTIKKKKKVIPNLTKFFRGKKNKRSNRNSSQ